MTLPNLVLWMLFWMDLWGLSKNKKLLNDLIEKEKGYRNAENTSDNESNNDENWKSGGAGGGRNLEDDGVEDDSKESDKDTQNYSQETESSSPETSTTFHSENPFEHCENSNVCETLIMKCP